MVSLISSESLSLKDHPEINESLIQEFIFNNPKVLGLGNLNAIRRERTQPTGGRIDMVLGSSDDATRYEVEIQLGPTDPSHIIRTIEYWDNERKRYTQYDHCAVIVAENITGRFMNVISLFNGAIPLIALQMTALKASDNEISLVFTKVLDKITPVTDEEANLVTTDRKYWETKSTKKMIQTVDDIFLDLAEYVNGFELKYNQGFIGMARGGVAKNFIEFQPKKKYLYMNCKGEQDDQITTELEETGLEVTYDSRWKQNKIKLYKFEDYSKNRAIIIKCVEKAREYFNLTND